MPGAHAWGKRFMLFIKGRGIAASSGDIKAQGQNPSTPTPGGLRKRPARCRCASRRHAHAQLCASACATASSDARRASIRALAMRAQISTSLCGHLWANPPPKTPPSPHMGESPLCQGRMKRVPRPRQHACLPRERPPRIIPARLSSLRTAQGCRTSLWGLRRRRGPCRTSLTSPGRTTLVHTAEYQPQQAQPRQPWLGGSSRVSCGPVPSQPHYDSGRPPFPPSGTNPSGCGRARVACDACPAGPPVEEAPCPACAAEVRRRRACADCKHACM